MNTAPEPLPDKTLPAIRQALSHPRDREGFDAGLPVAMEKARAAGDWREVEEPASHWRRCSPGEPPNGRGPSRTANTREPLGGRAYEHPAHERIGHGGEEPADSRGC
ncbi:DUF6247 family protein [Nonomuraea sp. NPDC002799]